MKNIPVGDVTALVTGNPSERQRYEGRGDGRRPVGRATDDEGRPVSGAPAVAQTPILGLLANATLLVPDSQAATLVAGNLVTISGAHVTLSGGDFGQVRATVTGTHATPLATFEEAIAKVASQAASTEKRG